MMIEINLLPGSKKSGKGGAGGLSFGGALGSIGEKVRDPWLIASASTVVLAVAAVGLLFTTQQARAGEVDRKIDHALRDSTRLNTVLAARRKVSAERDSVHRQVDIIRSIDDNRYTWAHILDEVSRALPAYTWLTVLEQTSKPPLPPGADTLAGKPLAPANVRSKGQKPPKETKSDKDATARADSLAMHPPLNFRIVGQTVDMQALTLFMKQLESSPFVQKVVLLRSEIVVVEGKDVTEFELTAEYETPSPTVIKTEPLVIPVR